VNNVFKKNKQLILGIYIDGGILIGNNLQEIKEIIKQLKREIKMIILYKPNMFVGSEITREDNIKLKIITKKILKQMFGIEKSKSAKIPI